MTPEMLCFFLFYSENQCASCGHRRNPWYAKFTHPEFKHCELVCFNGEYWVKFDSKGRTLNHRISGQVGENILDKIKEDPNVSHIVGVEVIKKVSKKWFGLKVDLCNSDAVHVSGIDVGITFSPLQLYKKLLLSFKKNFYVTHIWSRYGAQ